MISNEELDRLEALAQANSSDGCNMWDRELFRASTNFETILTLIEDLRAARRNAEMVLVPGIRVAGTFIRDAKRYRWLKENTITGSLGFNDWWINGDEPSSEWDSAIDAAMKEQDNG